MNRLGTCMNAYGGLSKLDWFPSTIEAFWGKKLGAYGFSVRFGILREST